MTARDYARQLVARKLDGETHTDPDDWFHYSGGTGPARGDEPRYYWCGSGSPYQRTDGTNAMVPRGKLYVQLGGTIFAPADDGLFSVRVLITEVRSGHTQAGLF